MYSHRWTCAALLMLGWCAVQSTVANAQERIGIAASTVPNVEGIMGSNSQTLSAGSELFANQTIRTGNRGVADLVFVDKTNLSVGPTSEVKLDKFVYDPSGSKGQVVMQATRGAFRFVTGSQDHSAYAIKTPYGTLGVRGTTVEVVLASRSDRKLCLNEVRPSERCQDECVAKIRLAEGAGATYTTFTGKTANLTEVGAIACITPNGNVLYTTGGSLLSFDVAGGPPSPIGNPPPGGNGPPGCVPPVSPGKPTCL